MNEIYGLYCVCGRCGGEGIRYVGQTTKGAETRFQAHRYEAAANSQSGRGDLPVYRWMRKHGIRNIRYEVLETVDSAGLLNDAEIRWIAEKGTFTPGQGWGLNLTSGGSSLPGYRHTVETREKMRARTHSPETREKMSQSAKARGAAAHLQKSEVILRRMSNLPRGEKNPSAKIDSEMALKIWTLLQETDSSTPIADVARVTGVSRSTVSNINYGMAWNHVTGLDKRYG